MMLSDISVKRPVFATVVSLLLIAFGVLSFSLLPLREYPDIDAPIVSISTSYPGASADIVETKITQIIEDEISGIEGIRSIDSTSRDGRSSINIEFNLSRDIDFAANDVRERVSRMLRRLPDQADPPEVAKAEADSQPILWFALTSPNMDGMELTDYAQRYIVDQLTSVDGVSRVRLGGERRYAMRIWLDRTKLAARGLTIDDVEQALRAENVELPAGRLESTEREIGLRIARTYRSPADFAALVLKRGDKGYLVRLGEVAEVEIGPVERRSEFRADGIPNIGIGIIKQSKANTLEVARAVKAKVAAIGKTLPDGMALTINSDDSVYIEAAISEVYATFAIAMTLVILVIYLFLGSVRAMLVPAVTVPVSITASFIILAACGYSVNLVTLLALVLAIGLVVDDSIIVLENIYRRMELGEPPLVAAYRGARQVGMAVVATTLVLVVVFVPIMFLGGNVGRVFNELAVAMAGAVGFSGLIALTLSPMMCSKLLRPSIGRSRLNRAVDLAFERAAATYVRLLEIFLARPAVVVAGMAGIFGLIAFFLYHVPQEFAPTEDRGKFFIMVSGPEGATFEATVRDMRRIETLLAAYKASGEAESTLVRVPAYDSSEQVNTGLGIVNLANWDERRTSQEIMSELHLKLRDVPGVFAIPSVWGGLKSVGGGRGKSVQFVIGGDTYEELSRWQGAMMRRLQDYPGVVAADSDLKERKPQIMVTVDQSRAADLGVSVGTVGRTLETMFNARRVTTYVDRGEEYDVILQGLDENRRSPRDMTDIYVRSQTTGLLVPLSSLVHFEERGTSVSLNRFNRLRSVTISANVAPGYTLGEVLEHLEAVAAEELPATAQISYKGESRELRDSSMALLFIFSLALLVVYLVLAAQFESFVHPTVIMLTVPLALAGALIGLFMTGGTLNIYSEIGIVMLIGIAAKNGILIVEFANQLRDAGRSFEVAIVEACRIRLRPILMTSIATVIGAVPLILAAGAGAESRRTIGVVIFSGVSFATLFTLFVVPVFYMILARRTTSPGHVAARLDELLEQKPAE